MRDVCAVKAKRDDLKRMMNKMKYRMEDMKIDCGKPTEMDSETRRLYYAILGLHNRYLDQVRVLEFVLNEDSEMDIPHSSYFDNVREFLI